MTAQSDALEAKLPVLNAIPKEDVKILTMPMERNILEARYVHKWCQSDKERLIATALDWRMVEDIPLRADAASEAQANWYNVKFSREEAQEQWKNLSPAGYELRDEILHNMRYAYRNTPAMTSRVTAVAEGSSDSDMIQDLNAVAVIGRENLAPLKAIGFDPAKLEEAANKSKELATLRADASVDNSADREKKLLRDRAYTHLKEAVDALRECGQFVFWKDDDRRRGYTSDYNRQRNSQKSKPAGSEQ